MELQKAAGEVENSRLKQRVQEQEALLLERQARLDKLEGEVETRQKTIIDLTFQKSRLENDINRCRTELEIAVKDKASSEQALSLTKQLIEQSEARLSLAEKNLEDLLKTTGGQDLKRQSPELQRKINIEEGTYEQVQSQVPFKERGRGHVTLSSDSQSMAIMEPESPAVREHESINTIVMQQKQEELVLIHKRAELAEEEAQSYKKLLDDSNNTLEKLQMDIETERINMRKQSEDVQQEALHMKKSINELQEEIRSLQRAKSSLEQNTFFQSTEVEGLKEQLKISQEELHKKGSMEQENVFKINNLEEEVASNQTVLDHLKLKYNELTRINVSSDSEIRGLKIQKESLEKERLLCEEKIKLLKSEIERWKHQVQTANEQNNILKRTEHASQLKCNNLEAELKKKELVASQLQKMVDELNQFDFERENNLKNTTTKLDQATLEMNSKDQQIKIFKSQVESTKSQVRIVEEELKRKSQTSHELQMKLQDYSEEGRNVNELQQKIHILNSRIDNYEKEIAILKSELGAVFADNNSAKQKIRMQNAELNDLTMILKKKNAELEKESSESQQHLNKAKPFEDELFKNKLSGLTGSSENLKQDLCDKRAADRNVENLNVQLSELSSSLQRTKDELMKETREGNIKETKILQMETELQKNRVRMKESMSSSNLQQENSILKREKAEALDKSISLGCEVRRLTENLLSSQKEAEQRQKENAVLQLRSQQMEEQLEKCKKMLEELKSKLQLQKEGYESQLLLVHSEIQNKLILLQSEFCRESGTSQQRSNGEELLEMLNRYFKQDLNQMHLLHQTNVETEQLQIQMNQPQHVNTKLEEDLLKAVGHHEPDTLAPALQSKEQSSGTGKLTDRERKLTPKENEAKSLRQQIESYVQQVKRLQEKLLTLEVRMETEKPSRNEQEVTETSRECDLEHEVLRRNVSSEMATMEKENILEGLKQVKRDKIMVTHSQSLEDFPSKKTVNGNITLLQKVVQKSQTKPDETMTVTTHGDMAVCGLRHPTQRITKTTTYRIKETCASDSQGKQSAIYPPSQKLAEIKGSTTIQNAITCLDEEVARRSETGLVTADDAQFAGKPTTIAGVYVESSKKKISFLEAAEKGFLANTYAIDFLEAQAATGSLTDLTTGQTHSVAQALERGVIDAGLKDRLMEAQKAVSGYIHAGQKLSVFQAMEERILDRYRGKKILEVQVAAGGLVDPEIGVRVPVSVAVDHGLLNEETLQGLCDPTSNPKGFHNPDTGQKAYYSELLKMCLYDIDGGVFLFPFGEKHLTSASPASSHRVSVVGSSCGLQMSAHEAFKGRHINRSTYLFLSKQESDWQEKSFAGAGGSQLHILTDIKGGRQLCLESALSQRFLETSELESYRNGLLSANEIADLIFSRMVVVEDVHSPIAGLWDVTRRSRRSVFQGFQQGLTDRATASRLLEAQACTGGICDPSSGEKVSLTEALQRGLLDESLNEQLQPFEQAFNGIVHPKTSKTVSVSQAVQENLLPKEAGFRCIEFQLLTGGLINPGTHDRVSLEEFIQSGLVDKVTAAGLKDEKFQTKSLTCPKTKRRITFREALERSVYDCHTGLRLLEATKVHGFGAKTMFHYAQAYK
ncbi:uncharacterized protein AB9W97_019287 [Spinachia spinachia]